MRDLEVEIERKFVPFEVIYHLAKFGDFWMSEIVEICIFEV
jgi:hypothetical protein